MANDRSRGINDEVLIVHSYDLDKGALNFHYTRLLLGLGKLSAPERVELFKSVMFHASKDEVEVFKELITGWKEPK